MVLPVLFRCFDTDLCIADLAVSGSSAAMMGKVVAQKKRKRLIANNPDATQYGRMIANTRLARALLFQRPAWASMESSTRMTARWSGLGSELTRSSCC